MHRTRIFLVVLVSAFVAAPLCAQVTNRDNFGTEFYFAFFPNEGGEGGFVTKNTDDLYLTSRVPTQGEVDVPALNFYQTFTTAPGKITTIVLPNGNFGSQSVLLSESMDQQVVHGMAVHITSDSAIAVFGMNHMLYSSDAFMALPTSVLGTEYRTINYPTSEPSADGDTPGEFVIVATHDSTNVTVTLKAQSSVGTPPNSPVAIRMNAGDVYLVQGNSRQLTNDLTGSHIESDYPVAVLSGHKRTEIPSGATNVHGTPSRDLLVEQLPPVSAWGDSALVVPFATSQKPDLVRAVCAEDGTTFTVNGTAVAGTYNAGDFYEIPQLSGVTALQASKPIEVGQYMHTSWGDVYDPPPVAYGDPALALVYPVEQFDTAYTIISIVDADAFTGNFVNIVADAASLGTMMLDGQPIPASEFKPIPNSRFSYAQHQLTQGTHILYGAKPFGATVYALGPVDSYAYTGGTSLKTITPLKTAGLIIDFGDRVLSLADTTGDRTGPIPVFPHVVGSDAFDTTVVLTNVSEDIVNIYSFPKRVSDTDRFNVIRTAPASGAPAGTAPALSISPLTTDSFTIEFWPHELNRRLHTQIIANTDHLRAYVVDVYGRGVSDDMGIYGDSAKTYRIDTIDFGTFTNTDPSADSEVYVGNAGTATMTIASITGPSTPDFTQTGVLYQGIPQSIPFSIGEPPSGSARVGLRFLPAALANNRYFDSITISSKSSVHKVYLLARVETISPLSTSVPSVGWGTTLVCNDSFYNISIPNPNELPVTVTHAIIAGKDPGDFAIATQTPLIIPGGQTGTIQVAFLPTGRGPKNAEAILSFDLPKNAKPDTIALAGTGDKLRLELAAQQNVHAYALDNTILVPIYARTDLTPFSPTGYELHVYYDSVNLKLEDVHTNQTLTPTSTYPAIFHSSPPGNDTILCEQGGEGGSGITAITGGGPSATPAPYGEPLIYLKFQPILGGTDPNTFQKGFPIRFDITFDNPRIPYTCADHIYDSGFVQVDPACDTQYIEPQPAFPTAMMLGNPTPNPASQVMHINYDVGLDSSEANVPVTIDAVDAQGNVVATLVNAIEQPGYYTATLQAQGLPSGSYLLRMTAGAYRSARKLIIQR